MVTDTLIELKDISLGYKSRRKETLILEHLDLTFHGSELIGIAGINGSGKSTLLKALCGLLQPLNGEIEVYGNSLKSLSAIELAKRISIVLTEKVSGFNLTCFDAVASGQLPYTNLFHSLSPDNINIIDQAIRQCRLEEHREKLLSELSDGLFQKTMIAKCIAQQTPLMLLDEPTAFLDYASKHELFMLLRALTTEKQKCVLVSSHDLDLLLKYCDKLLLVNNSTAELIPVAEAKRHVLFKELSGGYL